MTTRRILITGAGRGIGRSTALAFASQGAELALCARSRDQLEAVAKEVRALGCQAHVIPVDLAQHAAIGPACTRAIEALGGSLDVLVNNAGIFDMRPIESMPLDFWQRMIDVNLTAPMLVAQACIAALSASSAPVIINVASRAGETGYPGNVAYCASKYGLRGVSDALRAELAERGFAVRTVFPGGTDTSIFDGVEGDWQRSAMDSPEGVADLIIRAAETGAPDELRMYPRG